MNGTAFYVVNASQACKCPIFFLSKVAPWDTELRIMRADCHENMGDYINAISDIK